MPFGGLYVTKQVETLKFILLFFARGVQMRMRNALGKY